jgi:plastocyanin
MNPRQGTVAALASIAMLAGCGGGDSGDSGSSDPAPSAAMVNIADFKYAPPEVRVATGGTVTFTNTDRADHTATTSEGAASEFDTGRLGQGAKKEVRVERAGRYAYICTFHPYMKGTVVAE